MKIATLYQSFCHKPACDRQTDGRTKSLKQHRARHSSAMLTRNKHVSLSVIDMAKENNFAINHIYKRTCFRPFLAVLIGALGLSHQKHGTKMIKQHFNSKNHRKIHLWYIVCNSSFPNCYIFTIVLS